MPGGVQVNVGSFGATPGVLAGTAGGILDVPVSLVTNGTSVAAVSNDLIYDGATPVRSAEDVVNMLDWGPRNRVSPPADARDRTAKKTLGGLGPSARRVLDALSVEEPAGSEELAERLQMPAPELLGSLLELELQDLAVALPGRRYLRKS